MTVARCHVDELPEDVLTRLTADSLYSSPGFARVWREQGGRDVGWVASSNGDPLAVLLAIEFGTTPVKRLQAMPDGLQARIVHLAGEDDSRQEVEHAILDRIAAHGYARVYINDSTGRLSVPKSYNRTAVSVSCISLDADDWQPPDKKLRSEIRKAGREGVTVRPYQPADDLEAVMHLVARTHDRHGSEPRYTTGFFRSLGNLADGDDRVKWQVAEYDDKVVAAQIFFVDGESALYWQSYSDRDFSFLKASQLVLFSSARDLQQHGVRLLSLGQTPADAGGLARFKQKWGGREHDCTTYSTASLLGRLV